MSIEDTNDPRHGTSAGYQAHYRSKGPLCEACREWKRGEDRGRWRRRSRTAGTGKTGRPEVIAKAAKEDIDWVVVHRIVHEKRMCEANTAERIAVIHQWTALGGEFKVLEALTGWNVDRYRRAMAKADEAGIQYARLEYGEVA